MINYTCFIVYTACKYFNCIKPVEFDLTRSAIDSDKKYTGISYGMC